MSDFWCDFRLLPSLLRSFVEVCVGWLVGGLVVSLLQLVGFVVSLLKSNGPVSGLFESLSRFYVY